MKANFKPLSLAAAVATATAGYAGVSQAQNLPVNGLGDLAIIPYYTVQDEWGTGVHIINSSDRTQVVKVRLRRGSDSLDALDFNIVMSPYDHWTGFLDDAEEGGTIRMTTQDTSCTAPAPVSGAIAMEDLYREGADEGYIEVIAMGTPEDETYALAVNAKHQSDGEPLNCDYVLDNFLQFYFDQSFNRGVIDYDETRGRSPSGKEGATTFYEDADNVLKVSWFIRDGETGIEFGNDAVHIANFETEMPMITNQEFGLFSGDLSGFDFPDLNGTAPVYGNYYGNSYYKYNDIRTTFGVTAVLNDWSDNPDLLVGTDWIVTIPGQYAMLDLPEYLVDIEGGDDCEPAPSGEDGCDQRDIPVRAEFFIWDREEVLLSEPGDREIVVSPSLPGEQIVTELEYEVNVLHWSPERPVLDSIYAIDIDTSVLDEVSGWAKLEVTSKSDPINGFSQGICLWANDLDYTLGESNADYRSYLPGVSDPEGLMDCSTEAFGEVPMTGFIAWERSFPENPDGNYGRAVEHSFESSRR